MRRHAAPTRALTCGTTPTPRPQIRWRLADEALEGEEAHPDPAVRAATRAKIFLGYTSNLVSAGVREHIRYLVQVRTLPSWCSTPSLCLFTLARCSIVGRLLGEPSGGGGGSRQSNACVRVGAEVYSACPGGSVVPGGGRQGRPLPLCRSVPPAAAAGCTAAPPSLAPPLPALPAAPHGGRSGDHSGRGGGGFHQGACPPTHARLAGVQRPPPSPPSTPFWGGGAPPCGCLHAVVHVQRALHRGPTAAALGGVGGVGRPGLELAAGCTLCSRGTWLA